MSWSAGGTSVTGCQYIPELIGLEAERKLHTEGESKNWRKMGKGGRPSRRLRSNKDFQQWRRGLAEAVCSSLHTNPLANALTHTWSSMTSAFHHRKCTQKSTCAQSTDLANLLIVTNDYHISSNSKTHTQLYLCLPGSALRPCMISRLRGCTEILSSHISRANMMRATNWLVYACNK